MQRLKGFSDAAWEVVQKKPMAHCIDVASGNRQMYPESVKDSPLCIFCDEEPRLKVKPDLVSDWKVLHTHFPPDYFHCAIWDPPHIFSLTNQFNKTPWFTSNGSKNQPGWYGGFDGKRDAVREIFHGQESISKIAPRLCFKWNEAQMPVEWAISLLKNFRVQFLTRYVSPVRVNSQVKAKTWWVKLVRRTVDDKDVIKAKK